MHINGIDEIDNRIVNILLENGRASYSEIGEMVGLSRTAVKNRVAALEKSGIIGGYRAIISPQNSPEMMTFVVNIETDAEHFENAKELFTEAKETVTLVQTTGNCHLMAICVSKDMKTMKDFVNMIFKTADGIRNINAHAIIDIVKGNIIPE